MKQRLFSCEQISGGGFFRDAILLTWPAIFSIWMPTKKAKIAHSLNDCSMLLLLQRYKMATGQDQTSNGPLVICGDLTSWVGSVMPSLWQWPRAESSWRRRWRRLAVNVWPWLGSPRGLTPLVMWGIGEDVNWTPRICSYGTAPPFFSTLLSFWRSESASPSLFPTVLNSVCAYFPICRLTQNISLGYLWDIIGISLGYLWDIFGISLGYHWDIFCRSVPPEFLRSFFLGKQARKPWSYAGPFRIWLFFRNKFHLNFHLATNRFIEIKNENREAMILQSSEEKNLI